MERLKLWGLHFVFQVAPCKYGSGNRDSYSGFCRVRFRAVSLRFGGFRLLFISLWDRAIGFKVSCLQDSTGIIFIWMSCGLCFSRLTHGIQNAKTLGKRLRTLGALECEDYDEVRL